MTVTRIEYDGEEYEVKYSFKFIQRLKQANISVPRIFGAIQNDPAGAGYYLDDFVIVACECLREAGAVVTIDTLWDEAKVNPEFSAACAKLFMWLVEQHYATSANAPKGDAGAKKPRARRKSTT